VRSSRAAAFLCLAWGGALLGHLLGYLVAYPGDAARHGHLLQTGHGSFDVLVTTAGAAAAIAFAMVALRSVSGAKPASVARWAASLAAVQVPLFTLLELSERGFATATFRDRGVLAGLVAQVLVAVVSAVMARVLHGTVRAVLRLARPRAALRRPANERAPAAADRPLGRPALPKGVRWRAPPALLPV
jgi:hypothetical protein